MDAVHEALGVEPDGLLFVRDVYVSEWGRTVRLSCIYRLSPSAGQLLTITFYECRELKWRIYALDDGRDEAAVVEARLGRGGHRSPAHLLTDRFGLTLTYGELLVQPAGDAP